MAQFIYTMIGVSKIVPPNRTIIKDISLSFFPGAKIGLLGLNGAGKSTAEWILELDRGYGIPWEGNYSSWLEQKEQRLQREQSREKARQRSIHAELEWVRSNPRGRGKKQGQASGL